MKSVSVVIPSWQGRQHLETLLPTIHGAAEIIVADANSPDGTRDLPVRYVELDANRGFAYAVNRGIAAAKHDVIAVLNNDLKLHPHWLTHLLPHLETAPFACGKLWQWEGNLLDGTWDLLSLSGLPLRAGNGRKDSEIFSTQRRVFFAPWTAILLRRDYLEEVGPLDENFQSYLEDVDFGLRSLARGFQGVYEPKAQAWHRGSSTLGAWHPRQVALTSRNQLLLIAKHGGMDWIRRWPREVLAGQLLWGLAAARRGCLVPWLEGKRVGWATLRRSRSPVPDQLEKFQNELFSLTHDDPFWRLYWALTL